MALNLVHQTPTEFVTRFWRRVDDASRNDSALYHRLIWWLIERINSGDINENQARGAYTAYFGKPMPPADWTLLKTNKLIPMHDRWAAFNTESGL